MASFPFSLAACALPTSPQRAKTTDSKTRTQSEPLCPPRRAGRGEGDYPPAPISRSGSSSAGRLPGSPRGPGGHKSEGRPRWHRSSWRSPPGLPDLDHQDRFHHDPVDAEQLVDVALQQAEQQLTRIPAHKAPQVLVVLRVPALGLSPRRFEPARTSRLPSPVALLSAPSSLAAAQIVLPQPPRHLGCLSPRRIAVGVEDSVRLPVDAPVLKADRYGPLSLGTQAGNVGEGNG